MSSNQIIHDEVLDIVDSSDRVIGQEKRSTIYTKQATNFRVINALLVKNNCIWIPRRSAHKKIFPLCLDGSVGGHVQAGETYEQAFARELKEELNFEISEIKYKLLAKLTPHEHNVSAFMHVYIITTEKEPVFNTADFVSATWYTIDELEELIRNGQPTKGDLPALIKLLREYYSRINTHLR